jgi:hypothetical protein
MGLGAYRQIPGDDYTSDEMEAFLDWLQAQPVIRDWESERHGELVLHVHGYDEPVCGVGGQFVQIFFGGNVIIGELEF